MSRLSESRRKPLMQCNNGIPRYIRDTHYAISCASQKNPTLSLIR